ncbi:MAG: glycosyltransferase family A protein [Acidobacteriota bacterium]
MLSRAAQASALRVSVVVPVRNDPRIDGLLESLAAQRDAPDWELLVALDGSTRSPRIPARLPVRLLELPPRGPYAARNAAGNAARGDVLLFTDSDCVCPPDWIAFADRAFRDAGLEALQGGSHAAASTRLSIRIQTDYEAYVRSHAGNGYRSFCNTRNFAIRRSVFEKRRFLDAFQRGGDGMYGRLLEEAGVVIRYAPEWAVVHRHPTSPLVYARQVFRQGHDGARWQRTTGVNLFGETPEGRGPGRWLRGRTAGSPLLNLAAAYSLLGVAATLGAAGAWLPGAAGDRAFDRSARAAHLAGRLRADAPGG